MSAIAVYEAEIVIDESTGETVTVTAATEAELETKIDAVLDPDPTTSTDPADTGSTGGR